MSCDVDFALSEVFGLKRFREGQREIMDYVLRGRDAFVVQPTGSGKSLLYQLPAVWFARIARCPAQPVTALPARSSRYNVRCPQHTRRDDRCVSFAGPDSGPSDEPAAAPLWRRSRRVPDLHAHK